MRTRRLYQLYDLSAECVAGPLVIELRDNPAIRTFNTLLEDSNTMPGRYPDHYELRLVGIQDEETGTITAVVPLQTIATGAAWLAHRREERDSAGLTQ